jgi:hypothetical protein
MWFHFRVGGLFGKPARFVLANPEQTLGGWNWENNRPVWRAIGQPWARLENPVRLDLPSGRVEWAWDVPAGADEVEVAHCFPYQQADLAATLADLSGVFQTAPIGVTYGNRELPRVFNRLPDAAALAVYLTARHHAGETPGSWVLDGLLRHVAATPSMEQAIAWWAAPFVDLDDVSIGSYGKDPWPHDCNRNYAAAGGPRRPETAAIECDVRRLKQASSRLMFVDLHAPAHAEQTVYLPLRGWTLDDKINPIAEEFANLFNAAQPEELRSPIAHVTPNAGSNSRHVGLSSSRWATEVLQIEAVTIETTYQGNGRRYYTVDDYRRLGAALAQTIVKWLQRPARPVKA